MPSFSYSSGLGLHHSPDVVFELAPKLIDSARTRVARLEAESDELTTARAALGFKPVPEDLKARIGVNEGALEAHRNILRKEEAERDRLNLQFDTERIRLQQLWGGAAPGSEPPAPAPAPVGAGRGRNSPRADRVGRRVRSA